MKVSCSLAKCPRTIGKTSTKKKVMNRNKEKRVKESNSLLFNSQTILPHIAKGKNALKCIKLDENYKTPMELIWKKD